MDKMKLFEFQEKAESQGLKVFSTMEFQRLMKLKRKAAQELIGRYLRKGVVVKLRNNCYSATFNPPSTYLMSNRMYQPSYVSFETALSHHGIIPETVYEVTAATTKTTRAFKVLGKMFRYHRIKEAAYTGYSPIKVDGDTILMADPEKALIDYLYFVNLGKKSLNERLNLEKVDGKKMLKYSRLYKGKKFIGFVKNAVC